MRINLSTPSWWLHSAITHPIPYAASSKSPVSQPVGCRWGCRHSPPDPSVLVPAVVLSLQIQRVEKDEDAIKLKEVITLWVTVLVKLAPQSKREHNSSKHKLLAITHAIFGQTCSHDFFKT